MSEHIAFSESERDPLGLRRLPMQLDDKDGWPAIANALDERPLRVRQRWTKAAGWLTAAACLMLVAGLATRLDTWRVAGPEGASVPVAHGEAAQRAPGPESLETLIAMSQTLESQVRGLRDGNGAMPAESAVFVAELEDLVAQVDNQLSFSPRSLDLWGQRVNLLLDLAQIYQQQWEREYGRMASL